MPHKLPNIYDTLPIKKPQTPLKIITVVKEESYTLYDLNVVMGNIFIP